MDGILDDVRAEVVFLTGTPTPVDDRSFEGVVRANREPRVFSARRLRRICSFRRSIWPRISWKFCICLEAYFRPLAAPLWTRDEDAALRERVEGAALLSRRRM